jgi:uncharacterized ferredoxin-like protein
MSTVAAPAPGKTDDAVSTTGVSAPQSKEEAAQQEGSAFIRRSAENTRQAADVVLALRFKIDSIQVRFDRLFRPIRIAGDG